MWLQFINRVVDESTEEVVTTTEAFKEQTISTETPQPSTFGQAENDDEEIQTTTTDLSTKSLASTTKVATKEATSTEQSLQEYKDESIESPVPYKLKDDNYDAINDFNVNRLKVYSRWNMNVRLNSDPY